MKKLLLISASTLVLAACGTQSASDASLETYGVAKGAGSVGVHTVLEGDTVYKIAQNYQLPMREIITLNHIQAPYNLNVGFRVKLPAPHEHQVKEGDTIYSIARMYEVSINRLAQLNNINYPYRIRIGQTLRLPTPPQSAPQMQEAMYNEPARSAPTPTVQAETLGRSSNGSAQQSSAPTNNNAVTPQRKPTVQKASVQRTKIPKHTPKMSGNGRFMRPVEGQIISNYGPKAGGLHNDGINIRAPRGAPVRAAENGVVVYTGDDLQGYGNLVLVRHEGQMMSAYAHLDKTLIKRGDKVMRGQSIGTVGSSGQVDSPQLHFEIRKGSKPLNPAKYL